MHARGDLRIRQRHVRIGRREHALQQAALAILAVVLRRRQRQVRKAAEVRVRAVQQVVQARRLRARGCSGLVHLTLTLTPAQRCWSAWVECGVARRAAGWQARRLRSGPGCPGQPRRRAGSGTRQRRACRRTLAEPAPAAVKNADRPHENVFSAALALQHGSTLSTLWSAARPTTTKGIAPAGLRIQQLFTPPSCAFPFS